jgi:hypothetical protein
MASSFQGITRQMVLVCGSQALHLHRCDKTPGTNSLWIGRLIFAHGFNP